MKKEPDRITSLILNWKETGTGYRELIKAASAVIISYPKKKYNWDYDSCIDFYLAFYPKLIKLIDNFEYKGLSFNAILKNTVKWQIRSFYRKKRKTSRLDYCVRFHCIIEAEAAADSGAESFSRRGGSDLNLSEKSFRLLKIGPDGLIRSKALRKQIVMLTLKNSHFMDDGCLDKISALTGFSNEWLADSIRILRQQTEQRRRRYENYNIRISKAYMNLCRIHEEFNNCINLFEKKELEKKRLFYARRIKRANEARSKVILAPTNKEIAEVMELPKGSVDSGLYFLKKTLTDLLSSGGA